MFLRTSMISDTSPHACKKFLWTADAKNIHFVRFLFYCTAGTCTYTIHRNSKENISFERYPNTFCTLLRNHSATGRVRRTASHPSPARTQPSQSCQQRRIPLEKQQCGYGMLQPGFFSLLQYIFIYFYVW